MADVATHMRQHGPARPVGAVADCRAIGPLRRGAGGYVDFNRHDDMMRSPADRRARGRVDRMIVAAATNGASR